MEINNSKHIGELIRKTRKAQEIDQATLAMICGFSERPLKAIESGIGSLSVEKLLVILSELGIKMYMESPDVENRR